MPRLNLAQPAEEKPRRAVLLSSAPPPKGHNNGPALDDEPDYESTITFLPTGSTLLNLVLGGGWAMGRIANIVGDRSSGKTLLAIEACVNFALLHGAKNIRYAEAEAAFDDGYARSLGMPEGVIFPERFDTVEAWFADLSTWLKARKSNQGPCMYILDSLDALSDDAEMARDIDNGATYGGNKAKKLSEMFRRIARLAERKKCLLFVISQLRDNIGVMFGEKHKRSGGKALDFYCSQILWLAERGKIKRKVLGQERVVGLKVKAMTKKNKVGTPFRDAEMEVIFSYGVDDETSMLEWLKVQKATGGLALSYEECLAAIISCRKNGERDALADVTEDLQRIVRKRWRRVERELAPTMKKYGG